jgi:hypothetical protein
VNNDLRCPVCRRPATGDELRERLYTRIKVVVG